MYRIVEYFDKFDKGDEHIKPRYMAQYCRPAKWFGLLPGKWTNLDWHYSINECYSDIKKHQTKMTCKFGIQNGKILEVKI